MTDVQDILGVAKGAAGAHVAAQQKRDKKRPVGRPRKATTNSMRPRQRAPTGLARELAMLNESWTGPQMPSLAPVVRPAFQKRRG
jgi:hypothetical protein